MARRASKNNGVSQQIGDVFIDREGMGIKKIAQWAKRPTQYNSKMIKAYLQLKEQNAQVSFEELQKRCLCPDLDVYVPKFHMHFYLLSNDRTKSHGKIFVLTPDKNVEIWDRAKDELEKYKDEFLNSRVDQPAAKSARQGYDANQKNLRTCGVWFVAKYIKEINQSLQKLSSDKDYKAEYMRQVFLKERCDKDITGTNTRVNALISLVSLGGTYETLKLILKSGKRVAPQYREMAQRYLDELESSPDFCKQ